MKYNKETPFEIKSEEDWKKVKGKWYVSYICNTCGERHIKRVSELKYAKNTCLNDIPYRNEETPFEIKCEEDWKKVKSDWWVSYICNTCGEKHIKCIHKLKSAKNTCLNDIPYRNEETPYKIKSEEDWKNVKSGWYVSYICNKCSKRHIRYIKDRRWSKNICVNNIPYRNEETPFMIKSEEDWKKVKSNWWVSYICNTCGEKHIKRVSRLDNAKNTCLKKLYCNKESPFKIKCEEDWKNVKGNWWISYICSDCGENHIRFIHQRKWAKNICTNKETHYKIESPFEIKSEEDWKKVKGKWWVSYVCNTCGKRHIKRISESKYAKNTCIKKSKNIKINYHSNYVDRFIFAF